MGGLTTLGLRVELDAHWGTSPAQELSVTQTLALGGRLSTR
jgi:hypothetical protein